MGYVEGLRKALEGGAAATEVIEDDTLLAKFEREGLEAPEMALKVETDRWAGHHVEVGPAGIDLIMKFRGLAFNLACLEDTLNFPGACLAKDPFPWNII